MLAIRFPAAVLRILVFGTHGLESTPVYQRRLWLESVGNFLRSSGFHLKSKSLVPDLMVAVMRKISFVLGRIKLAIIGDTQEIPP